MSFLLNAFENQTSYNRQSSPSPKVLWRWRLLPEADMKYFHAVHSFVNAKNQNNNDSKTWRVLSVCFSAALRRMQDLRHIRTREGKSTPQTTETRSGKCQSTWVPWEQGEVRCGCIASGVSSASQPVETELLKVTVVWTRIKGVRQGQIIRLVSLGTHLERSLFDTPFGRQIGVS